MTRIALMVHERGRTTRVPIHSRRATGFDVDLGPGPDGGTVAVYSRCELRGRRRDCDIHQYDFRRRVEEVVPGVNTRRWSEQHPAIWRSRLAVVRRPYGWFEPRIFLAHPGGIRRLRGGSRAYEEASPPRVESIDRFPNVALDRRHAYFSYANDETFDPETQYMARRERIERVRPTFVEVTTPTFDE